MHFKYCPYCGAKAIQKEIGDEGIISYCNQCEIPLWDVFTTSIICAVINEQNEVALLRQNYVSETHFVCLAGIMKIGETVEETIRREVKEEIGLDVEWMEYIESYPYHKKEMLMLGYKVYVKKAEFILSKEVDSAEWIELKSALEKMREGSIAWKLVKQCMISETYSKLYNKIYKDIELIRTRPGMFIGNNKISTLRTFLDGYEYAHRNTYDKMISLEPLPFFMFHDFVANYYHESACMGWNGIILKQTKEDEEKGLELFFQLFDIFRSIKIANCQMAELATENIQYYYNIGSQKPYNLKCNKYIIPTKYFHDIRKYCIRYTKNYGCLLVTEYPDAFCFGCSYFISEEDIKEYTEYIYGQLKWEKVDKSVFFKKPVYQERTVLDVESYYKYK